jgi:uncharacterized BrkB/YihY/UPF0761 family membrane protein
LLILALFGLDRFAPNIEEQKLRWLLSGSVFAAVVWMVASVLFAYSGDVGRRLR